MNTSMRVVIAVLIVIVCVLQYRLWVGEGSVAELRSLQQAISDQQADLARLRARNQELRAEVDDLNTGLDAIEERARTELGMIKPGETFLQVIEPHQSKAKEPLQ